MSWQGSSNFLDNFISLWNGRAFRPLSNHPSKLAFPSKASQSLVMRGLEIASINTSWMHKCWLKELVLGFLNTHTHTRSHLLFMSPPGRPAGLYFLWRGFPPFSCALIASQQKTGDPELFASSAKVSLKPPWEAPAQPGHSDDYSLWSLLTCSDHWEVLVHR